MKFTALFAAMLMLFSALALTVPDTCDAARMGGGKSFGSKPFMRTPAAPPSVARKQTMAPPAAAAQKSGMFGGMGGIFGGLLAGTLLGSLLSGNGFGGAGGFMDIILLGILAFIAYKLFMRFRNRQAPQPAQSTASGFLGGGQDNQQPFSSPMQRSSTSEAGGWGALRGHADNAASHGDQDVSGVPADFNVDEFLRGAKMAYNRLQKAWDKRDLDDIAQFATPAVMEELKKQAAEDPTPGNTEIMLVNAQLTGFEKEGNDERAQVYFDVLMRESPNQPTPNQAREIWHFVRHGQDGEWKLEGIQQVE